MSTHTVLIVPAWSDQAGQCRIVAREGRIADALVSYRLNPDLWGEVGLMNSRGRIVCIEPAYRAAFADCQPCGGLVDRVEVAA